MRAMHIALSFARQPLSIPGLVTMPHIFGAEGYSERARFDLMLLRLDLPVLDRIFLAHAVARRHVQELVASGLVGPRSEDAPDLRLELPVDLPVSMHRSIVLEEFGWMRDDLQGHWLALPADFQCDVLGDGDVGCGREGMASAVSYLASRRRLAVRLHTYCPDPGTPNYFEAMLPLDDLRRLQRGLPWAGDHAIYDEAVPEG